MTVLLIGLACVVSSCILCLRIRLTRLAPIFTWWKVSCVPGDVNLMIFRVLTCNRLLFICGGADELRTFRAGNRLVSNTRFSRLVILWQACLRLLVLCGVSLSCCVTIVIICRLRSIGTDLAFFGSTELDFAWPCMICRERKVCLILRSSFPVMNALMTLLGKIAGLASGWIRVVVMNLVEPYAGSYTMRLENDRLDSSA